MCSTSISYAVALSSKVKSSQFFFPTTCTKHTWDSKIMLTKPPPVSLSFSESKLLKDVYIQMAVFARKGKHVR